MHVKATCSHTKSYKRNLALGKLMDVSAKEHRRFNVGLKQKEKPELVFLKKGVGGGQFLS